MATTSDNDIDLTKINSDTNMEPANHLLNLLKKLIVDKQYNEIPLLFTSDNEALHNLSLLSKISMNIFFEICQLALNDQNHAENLSLYNCAEGLLTLIASYAPFEELLLELLELIEDNKSEYVFTSSLQALQTLLLRSNKENPRAIEWSLNSIRTRINDLPLPNFLRSGYDPDQEKLLEQNEQIHNLLMHYVIIGLFFEPLVRHIGQNSHPKEVFRPLGATPSNVLCCFLLNLLGKPLSLLDLTNSTERKTNLYSFQCAKSLTQAVTRCIGDPYFFLPMIEHRLQVKCFNKNCKHEYQPDVNIFLRDDILPNDALAIYYYMLIVENVDNHDIPTVYHPLFVFESVMYLVNELLCCEEPALHEKGLKLTKCLLCVLGTREIPSHSLELSLHKTFCLALCNLVSYSTQLHLRQVGAILLRQYILQFERSAKYMILRNLLRTITHDGIAGYLAVTYKDIVAETLIANKTAVLPETFSSEEFRAVFLQNICKLPYGIETDILEHSHRIISTLNALRFFAINDSHNRTGFWDFIGVIEKKYLTTLRKSLDISIAHCKQKLYNIENGCDEAISNDNCDSLKMLNLTVANDEDNENKKIAPILELKRGENINILRQNLCTFDLIRSLLVRATECIEYQIKKMCSIHDTENSK